MAYTNATFYMDFENGSDAARTALTAVTVSNPSGTITRCNKTAHGLITGAVVDLSLFSSWLNGAWKITVVDADNFDLDGAVWQTTADASGTVTPRGGSSKADAWKTFASGSTSARTAPGDTVRVMASPQPTLVGDATWTRGSSTVTLASAVTADISTCDSAWTVAANVTGSLNGSVRKEGTTSVQLDIASGFTTGKVAYFATGTLDLSAYEQVSLWIRSTLAIAAGTYSIRLCSDTTGDVTVDNLPIPACAPTGVRIPVTLNKGAALGSSIQSVALYADTDPGTAIFYLDNIIACKAASAADALTLESLIGKVSNLSWTASTAYATGAVRRPTQPNRNGFSYTVTAGGGGNSGTSEPTWPLEPGKTVTDGALTWTCSGLEETWCGIQSIRGTTVLIDGDVTKLPAGQRGYAGVTETVATYKRETIKAGISSATTLQAVQRGGQLGALFSYSGGWDRTDMSVQDGETWLDNQSTSSNGYHTSTFNYVSLANLSVVRTSVGITVNGTQSQLRNCHAASIGSVGISVGNYSNSLIGIAVRGCGSNGINMSGNGKNEMRRIYSCSNSGVGLSGPGSTGGYLVGGDFYMSQNATFGVGGLGQNQYRPLYRITARENGTIGLTFTGKMAYLYDCDFTNESSPFATLTYPSSYLCSIRHNRIEGNHYIWALGGTIVSATDQRHTASGVSWKFRITSTARDASEPLELPIAKVVVEGGVTATISIWARRDNTNIKGRLRIPANQLPGTPDDIITAMEPSTDTWTQYSVVVTPEESGVIEVFADVWDGVGTTNNFWVDDLGVA